jgi:hypothetical protein|tara:strand:+ start:847 stop:1161 length:315 start_codon:yes stop_codon:yes gene_type:complete
MTKLYERGFPCFNLATANAVTVTASNNNSIPVTAILPTTKVVRVAVTGNSCSFVMTGIASVDDGTHIFAGEQEYFAVKASGLTPAFKNIEAGKNSIINLTEFDS